MAGNELSQSTVIKALAMLKLEPSSNQSAPQAVTVQSQGRGRKTKIEPSIVTTGIHEPKPKSVQGRGRQLQQFFASVNKSDGNLNDLKELQSPQQGPSTKPSLNISRYNSDRANAGKSNAVQSGGRGLILSSVNRLAYTGKNISNQLETQSKEAGLLNMNQFNNDFNEYNANNCVQKEEFKYFSTNPTRGPFKNVVCNAVLFSSNPIFEYTIHFHPDVISEKRRFGFVNKHFLKLGKTFLYKKFSVFVPNVLDDHELNCTLSNRGTADLFTMTLKFKQTINLEAYPQLLHVLFEQATEFAQKNLYVPESQMKIIPDYVIAIREAKNGTLLCLDRQYYLIQGKNIAEIMFELEQRYNKRFHQAVDVLLSKHSIFYEHDNKIYRMVKVEWANEQLELERNGHHKIVEPEDCNVAEVVRDISSYHPQTPKEFMFNIKTLFSSKLLNNDWNLQFGNFTKAKARVLKPETVTFGDGVKCIPKNGNWEVELRENKVLIPTELWCWMILYTPTDENCAQTLSNRIQSLQDDTGIAIGKPLFYKIESDTKTGYVNALKDIICKELQLIVVIIPKSPNKPEALIKHICCIPKPIPYQIVRSSDVKDPLKIHEITLQFNLMLGGMPWTVNLPYQNWMICGIDLRCAFDNRTLPVCSFVTAMTSDATQWYSKAFFVEHNFEKCFKMWLEDTLKKYKDTNGMFPSQLLLYQNCTEETRYHFYRDYENFNFDHCLKQLQITNMDICLILVQRDANISFYKDLENRFDNVPPGTIVDNTVTNYLDVRDFFLTSHCASNCTIARPTYYEVVKDTCGLTSEQLELITYKMCHLYYKNAKTVDVPAPCLYAEKLGMLVTEDICGIPSPNLDECLYYL